MKNSNEDKNVQIFAREKFWPITLLEINQFEACIVVPAELNFHLYERIALKVGNLPSFPASIRGRNGPKVMLKFVGPIHPSVIAQLGFSSTAP